MQQKQIFGLTLIIVLVIAIIGLLTFSFIYTSNDGSDGDSDEEGGIRLRSDEVFNGTLNGAHLTISYNSSSDSFVGVVLNPTEKILDDVRVEVHMYNGSNSKELGPTTPEDLLPGESRMVELAARGWSFDTWTAHPETGSSESGEGEHSEGEGHDEGGDRD